MKFMSLFVAAGVSLVAQMVFAQARSAGDLTRQAQNVARLIEDRADLMSTEQIVRVSQLLSEVRRAALGEATPIPGNPPGDSGRRMLVKGNIEMSEFSFDVRSQMELYQQCARFVDEKFGSSAQVDDIRVSINLGALRTLRNANSYWKGRAQICQQIMGIAIDGGLQARGTEGIIIGNIEGREFQFVGRDRFDIFGQCETFVNSTFGVGASVDDILVINNFRPERVLRNSNAYWKGSLEICTQVVN